MLIMPSFRTDLRIFAFRVYLWPTTMVVACFVVHGVMVMLSTIFDWYWWPWSNGRVNVNEGRYLLIVENGLYLVLLGVYFVYLRRWATPTTFPICTFVGVLLSILVFAVRLFHHQIYNQIYNVGAIRNDFWQAEGTSQLWWLSGCDACARHETILDRRITAGTLDSSAMLVKMLVATNSSEVLDEYTFAYGTLSLLLHRLRSNPVRVHQPLDSRSALAMSTLHACMRHCELYMEACPSQ